MTAKEYLNQARSLDFEIGSKQRELAMIKLNAENLHSPILGDRVISSFANTANRANDTAVDLEKEILTEIAELIALKADIHAKIQMLPNAKYRNILTDYYVTCDKWEAVAENNGYSPRQMRRKHKAALEMFAAIHKL